MIQNDEWYKMVKDTKCLRLCCVFEVSWPLSMGGQVDGQHAYTRQDLVGQEICAVYFKNYFVNFFFSVKCHSVSRVVLSTNFTCICIPFTNFTQTFTFSFFGQECLPNYFLFLLINQLFDPSYKFLVYYPQVPILSPLSINLILSPIRSSN